MSAAEINLQRRTEVLTVVNHLGGFFIVGTTPGLAPGGVPIVAAIDVSTSLTPGAPGFRIVIRPGGQHDFMELHTVGKSDARTPKARAFGKRVLEAISHL